MYTISDILMDIDRGCLANNMIEDRFTYRIVYFVNEGNNGKKFYTVLKRGKCTCLLSKSYSFSLEEYFKRIKGDYSRNRNNLYSRYAEIKGTV